ncbi:GNAT family N-acetyltransferase [Virgibacillus sp. L01]|uniref:GNAT family N-acetyltransferase n=1 Tax=Virgibacillus sp. L01 TaxID=3457429 RepID=UPI003FD2C337
MELLLRNGKTVNVREYTESDFINIQRLNKNEGWTNLVEKKDDTKQAWDHSNIAFVVIDKGEFVGYIRGITDKFITLFISELVVSNDYRGLGVGQGLLKYVHSLYPKTRIEMLATSTSRTYYEEQGYRAFYGFRKTFEE